MVAFLIGNGIMTETGFIEETRFFFHHQIEFPEFISQIIAQFLEFLLCVLIAVILL